MQQGTLTMLVGHHVRLDPAAVDPGGRNLPDDEWSVQSVDDRVHLPGAIRGDVVYELSADLEARWQPLGGMGGAAGEAVLVLTPRAEVEL